MPCCKPSAGFAYTLLCAVFIACSSDSSSVFFSKNAPSAPGSDNTPRTPAGSGATSGASASSGGAQNSSGSSTSSGATSGAQAGSDSGSSGSQNGATGGGTGSGQAGETSLAGSTSVGGADGSGAGETCTSNETCGTGKYCKRSSCLAVTGTCADVPKECDNSEEPVCGCDGFTYINRCLAELNAQNVASDGMCQETALRCGTQSTCKGRSRGTCAYIYERDMCPRTNARLGSCWVLPDVCSEHGNIHVRSCGPDRQCRHLCEAAATEAPHYMSGCGE